VVRELTLVEDDARDMILAQHLLRDATKYVAATPSEDVVAYDAQLATLQAAIAGLHSSTQQHFAEEIHQASVALEHRRCELYSRVQRAQREAETRATRVALCGTEAPRRGIANDQQACDLGSAGACRRLGEVYNAGDGVSQNDECATALLQRACDLGDMVGCLYLGMAYEAGRGIVQDVAHAAVLYRRACDHGEHEACIQLRDLRL
jgi:hypothetical protein